MEFGKVNYYFTPKNHTHLVSKKWKDICYQLIRKKELIIMRQDITPILFPNPPFYTCDLYMEIDQRDYPNVKEAIFTDRIVDGLLGGYNAMGYIKHDGVKELIYVYIEPGIVYLKRGKTHELKVKSIFIEVNNMRIDSQEHREIFRKRLFNKGGKIFCYWHARTGTWAIRDSLSDEFLCLSTGEWHECEPLHTKEYIHHLNKIETKRIRVLS